MSISIRHAFIATTFAAASIFTYACGESGSQAGAGQAVTAEDDGGDGSTAEGGDSGSDASTGDASASATLAQPQLTVCSEAQALAIFAALNNAEIVEANAVVNRLQNASAKQFAQQMIQDHTALSNALQQLIASSSSSGSGSSTGTGSGSSTGSTAIQPPEENSLSRAITASARLEIQSWANLSGAELDSAYMDTQVLDHLKTLGIGDHLVTPSFKNPQLIAAAAQARAIIVGHSQQAVKVQEAVEGGACGTSGDGGTGTTDGGTTTDSGTTTDGGGTTTDSGTTTDGGTTTDSGTTTDGGGTTPDSGTTTDSGTGTTDSGAGSSGSTTL